jgi:hypothetical protein
MLYSTYNKNTNPFHFRFQPLEGGHVPGRVYAVTQHSCTVPALVVTFSPQKHN